MSLIGDITAALSELRAEAEARMTSTCTVRRQTGTRTPGSDGIETDGWTVVHAGLALRLAGASRSASPTTGRDNGAVEVNHAHREAHFPIATANLADGDLIEITTGENAGAILRIVEAALAHDQATALRVPVEATERPRGW